MNFGSAGKTMYYSMYFVVKCSERLGPVFLHISWQLYLSWDIVPDTKMIWMKNQWITKYSFSGRVSSDPDGKVILAGNNCLHAFAAPDRPISKVVQTRHLVCTSAPGETGGPARKIQPLLRGPNNCWYKNRHHGHRKKRKDGAWSQRDPDNGHSSPCSWALRAFQCQLLLQKIVGHLNSSLLFASVPGCWNLIPGSCAAGSETKLLIFWKKQIQTAEIADRAKCRMKMPFAPWRKQAKKTENLSAFQGDKNEGQITSPTAVSSSYPGQLSSEFWSFHAGTRHH